MDAETQLYLPFWPTLYIFNSVVWLEIATFFLWLDHLRGKSQDTAAYESAITLPFLVFDPHILPLLILCGLPTLQLELVTNPMNLSFNIWQFEVCGCSLEGTISCNLLQQKTYFVAVGLEGIYNSML